MTEEIKHEALDQLELEIKFGFRNEHELFESIREMFYDEKDFDEAWLKKTLSEKYLMHQTQRASWTHPTDFERLAKTFDELISGKIVCLHNAGETRSDGEEDCMEAIEQLDEAGINAIGFCYYHSQDLARAVDTESRILCLGFGSSTGDDDETLLVANTIIDKLTKNGFKVNWSGTIDKKIEIENVDWKKVPDDQEWGAERVIQILSKSEGVKNLFGNSGRNKKQ